MLQILVGEVERLAKRLQFAIGEVAPRPALNVSQLERSDAGSNEPRHRVANLVEHAPDDTIAPLMDHDTNDGAIFSVANRAHFRRERTLAVDCDAATKAFQRGWRWMSVQQRFVFLVQLVARVHHAIGDLAIVRQQQKSLGVAIQPTNRQDTALHADEVHHRIAPTFVGCCRDVALRLVQQQIAATRIGDELPVNLNLLPLTIDLRSQLSDDLTIDANSPFGDEFLGSTARCDTAL